MKKYKLRDGVELTKIADMYYLVTLRPLWDEIPFIREVPNRHYYLIQCLLKGLDDQEMLAHAEITRFFSAEAMVSMYHGLKDNKLYTGCFEEMSDD